MELFFVLIMSQCGYFLWFFCVGSVFIRKKKCVEYYANDGGRRCGFEILAATPALCLMNMKASETGGNAIKSHRGDLCSNHVPPVGLVFQSSPPGGTCTNFGLTNQITVT